MYKNQIPTIEDFGKRIKRGTFGLYAALLTEKKMNKYPNGTLPRDRKTTPENPYIGKVFSLSIYQNAATGMNYYNIVKAECEREGIHFSDAEFAVAFPKEGTYCDSVDDELANIIMEHNDTNQRYLRLYEGRKPTKVVHFTIYDNNGVMQLVAEDSEMMNDIKRYISPKAPSAKQEALGIRNIVGVKQPKIENVVFLAQGEDIFINPRFGFVGLFNIENINKMFVGKK
jgi:hypothetical protein